MTLEFILLSLDLQKIQSLAQIKTTRIVYETMLRYEKQTYIDLMIKYL